MNDVMNVMVDVDKMTAEQREYCLRQWVENYVDFVDHDYAGSFSTDWHCSGVEVFIGSEEEFNVWCELNDVEVNDPGEDGYIMRFDSEKDLLEMVDKDTDIWSSIEEGYFIVEPTEENICKMKEENESIKHFRQWQHEKNINYYFKDNCPKYYKSVHGELAC